VSASDAITEASTGRGGVILLEGPAGIGKTTLVQRVAEASQEAGIRVLSARGGELEHNLGFGIVGQLFAKLLRGSNDLLAGSAAPAGAIFGISRSGTAQHEQGDRTLAILHSLYWLTVNASDKGPLALLVDDAHWADLPSLRFFSYLAHRIDGLPVLMVVASRSGASGELLARAVSGAKVLQVPPLGEKATGALVRSAASGADEEVCRACYEVTKGNPFFVLELARAARAEGLETGPANARRLLDWSPESVTRFVGDRLASLSPSAQAVARAAAVLGQGASLRHAAAISGLGTADASAAADELAAAGVIGPGRPLEFVHPIVRSAVYDGLPRGERSGAHAACANLLAGEGAAAEKVAMHVMRCEPSSDGEACLRLVSGAREAVERGAPDAALEYLRRALEEPPPAEAENRVLVELAVSEGLTFQVDAAAEHLQRAFHRAHSREERLDIAMLFAALAGHNARATEAIELLSRVRAEYVDDPHMRSVVEAQLVNTARFEMQARSLAMPIARELLAGADGNPEADAAVLAAVAAELAMSGSSCRRVAEVAQRGLGALKRDPHLMGSLVYLILVRTLIVADCFDEAGAALEPWLLESRRRGSVLGYAFASLFRADLMYRRGDVFEAEADCRGVYAFCLENEWPMGRPVIAYHLLESLTERAELKEAATVLGALGLTGPAADQDGLYTSNLLLFARGRLSSAGGQHEAAIADLVECGERENRWGEWNPALIPWRSEAALAWRALGRMEEARALAEEEVQLARRFGAPRALGMALRAQALVHGGPEGLELAREASDVLCRSHARLEYARALADRAAMERALGTQADSAALLREALELADICGAVALQARVLAELRAGGARPRRPRLSGPQALTPSERRVARMAAEGLSNREIAEALFVTTRTVEFHLRGVYRKLHVSGRRELETAQIDCGDL
jgi:DNA-binding CsgD family transcriptional regulator